MISSAHAQAVPQNSLPYPDSHFNGFVGSTYLDSDPAKFPQPVKAPKGAPNVLLILLDDVGFGQFSVTGGGVSSPAIEKLAKEGLIYNRFHTTALCSPTRASLLTGRGPQSSGTGIITELATGYDGYTGIIPQETATVAEVLRQNGYSTAWIGKNHNTPIWETSPNGPFTRWPTGLGFNYFYGFNAGDISQFEPNLVENTNPVSRSKDPNYHLSTDLADHAIAWIRQTKAIEPDKPFFAYVAPAATHSPHHAPKEWIDKFKGQFDMGWDRYREMTFERQKRLGVIPTNAVLTPRPASLPSWDSVPAGQRKLFARMMEVFAGYGAHVDHEMGRVIAAVKELPDADNTMIIYIVGDNGSSAEGGMAGSLNEMAFFNGVIEKVEDILPHIDELGGPKHFNHFPAMWAHAMNTPFQWTKQVASHFGGTRNPMIISWPAKIKEHGGLRSQFHHVSDVVPTILEAAGIAFPSSVNGIEQKPIEGVSMAYTFNDAKAADSRRPRSSRCSSIAASIRTAGLRPRYPSSRGMRCAASSIPTLPSGSSTTSTEDFTQAKDLAKQNPEKLASAGASLVGGGGAQEYPASRLAWCGPIFRRNNRQAQPRGRPRHVCL